MKRDLEHSFQIRIACMPVVSEVFMPYQIARFSKTYPEAKFFLRAQPSNRVQESMASQQIDLGFAEAPEESELYSAKDFRRNKNQFVVFVTPIIKASASQGSEGIKRKFRLRE